MIRQGKNLDFISQINRNGSGTIPVTEVTKWMEETTFRLGCLSITHQTYIAMEFNSYVVKIKSKEQ